MQKKLSDRAILILMAIRDRCNWPNLDRFWLNNGNGRGMDDYIEELSMYVNMSGSGDAAILRSLEKNGLIKRPKTTLPNKYVFVITEDGVLAIEQAREKGRLQKWIDAKEREQERLRKERGE